MNCFKRERMQNSSVNPTKSKNRDKEKNDQVNNEKRKQIQSCPCNNSPAILQHPLPMLPPIFRTYFIAVKRISKIFANKHIFYQNNGIFCYSESLELDFVETVEKRQNNWKM